MPGSRPPPGLTTTGATILSDLDALPRRSCTTGRKCTFFGGMGIVVLAVAAADAGESAGCSFTGRDAGADEGREADPHHRNRQEPLVHYVSLNVVCALAFWAAGMSPFDAICHAFTTIALGGFSTHDASIGYYQNPLIELIAGTFALIAAVNFALYFLAWRRGSIGMVFDAEFRFS